MYHITGGWSKTRIISTGYNQVTTFDGTFQSVGTAIMVVDKVLRRAIAIGQ